MKLNKYTALILAGIAVIGGNLNASAFDSKTLMKKMSTWAQDEEYGIQTYDYQVQDNLTVNGFARLNGTHVADRMTANGVLICEKGNIGYLEVNGAVTLTNSKVNKGIDVNGLFVAKSCELKGTIQVSSDFVAISDSTVDHVMFRNNGSQKQVLVLEKGTVIANGVEFQSGNGVIIQKGEVTINGPILGAKTILKK